MATQAPKVPTSRLIKTKTKWDLGLVQLHLPQRDSDLDSLHKLNPSRRREAQAYSDRICRQDRSQLNHLQAEDSLVKIYRLLRLRAKAVFSGKIQLCRINRLQQASIKIRASNNSRVCLVASSHLAIHSASLHLDCSADRLKATRVASAMRFNRLPQQEVYLATKHQSNQAVFSATYLKGLRCSEEQRKQIQFSTWGKAS